MPGAEVRIAEQRFHNALRIVEGAFHGNGMHIVFGGGGHLLALHIADAPMRKQI